MYFYNDYKFLYFIMHIVGRSRSAQMALFRTTFGVQIAQKLGCLRTWHKGALVTPLLLTLL